MLQEAQNPCFPINLCIFLSGGISSYSYIACVSLLVFLWHSLLTISQSSRYQKCSPRLSRPACLHGEGLFLSWCSYHNWVRVGNQTSSDNPVQILLIFKLLESLGLCQICNVSISDIESLLAKTQLGFIDSRCSVGEGHSQTTKTPTSPILKDFCKISRSLPINPLSKLLLIMFFSLLA